MPFSCPSKRRDVPPRHSSTTDIRLGAFEFLLKHQITTPDRIAADHIRRFLVGLQDRGLKDTTQHAHARGIKPWFRWLVREGDLEDSPLERVDMPKLEQRIPPPFSPEHIRELLAACDRRTDLTAQLRHHPVSAGFRPETLRIRLAAAGRCGPTKWDGHAPQGQEGALGKDSKAFLGIMFELRQRLPSGLCLPA